MEIQVLESIDMPDGTDVLATILPNADHFWLKASEPSPQAVWDDPEDDIYAELLSTVR